MLLASVSIQKSTPDKICMSRHLVLVVDRPNLTHENMMKLSLNMYVHFQVSNVYCT